MGGACSLGRNLTPPRYLLLKENTHRRLGEPLPAAYTQAYESNKCDVAHKTLSLQNQKNPRLRHLAGLARRKQTLAVTRQNRCTGIKLLLSNNAPPPRHTLFPGMRGQVQKFKLQWGKVANKYTALASAVLAEHPGRLITGKVH